MRLSSGDWKWGVVIGEWLVPIVWVLAVMAAAVAGCLLLTGCSGVPTQGAEQTAEVSPDAGGGDAAAERSGSEGRAEAGRDLEQDIRDMSEQVTDMSKTIEQHTTTIQETVQNQQSGQSELSGKVAEAVEKIGTLQQRVETLTDNSRQVRGLRSDVGELAERIGSIGKVVQETQSEVTNMGISKERLKLEEGRNERLWRFGQTAAFVMFGLLMVAIAADGPQGWKGKVVFYGLGVVLVLSAAGVYFGG